ncbi:MAG: zinc ribbon domain-containing protein [Desulfuromonadales bacterium]|nr:zinc ribbon domain-containing protein [Desulfuromonadales bacterium]
MNCPKCGHTNHSDAIDCARCGVVFAKLRRRAASEGGDGSEVVAPESPTPQRGALGQLLFSVPEQVDSFYLWGRAIVLAVIAVWGFKLIFSSIASNAAGESVLHLINLPFHETGHIVFRPFGRFMTSLGGTLLQLIIPLVCLVALLLKTRDTFGAAVCLWWFGENFLDIAPYINDARAGVLPLVGGNFGNSSPYGFHDWEFILTETGLMRYDHLFAKMSHLFGSALMVLALLWGGYVLWLQYRR